MAKEFWCDKQVRGWIARRGARHVVAIGVSPSGPIHVGWLREMLIGDTLVRCLRDQGADAQLVLVLDDYDPLRSKRYPFLSEAFQAEHAGKPLSAVPAPFGDAVNYAETFAGPLRASMDALGVVPDRVRRATEMYHEGGYAEMIARALERRAEIAAIIAEETGRALDADWWPVSAIDRETGKLTGVTVTGADVGRHTVRYRTDDGREGEADFTRGEVKLAWRIDWPARWRMLGVTAEPFGKDHATQGGSYDTGKRIAKEVFDYEPPEPVVYEWINLSLLEPDEQGVLRKVPRPMASSSGVAISIDAILRVAPPELARYMILRVRPNKTVDFDPYDGLKQIAEEFERNVRRYFGLAEPPLGSDDRRLVALSYPRGVPAQCPVDISWRHLTTLVQIAAGDEGRLRAALVRAGYADQLERWDEIREKAGYVKRWLETYAPEGEVLTLAREAPPAAAAELDAEQRCALVLLADYLQAAKPDGEAAHQAVYAIAGEVGISGAKVFEAIYRALLGTTRGPRAGWFIVSLEPELVQRRFREV